MADDKENKNGGEPVEQNATGTQSDTGNSAGNSGGNSGSNGESSNDNESIRKMVRDEIQSALKDFKPGEGTPTPRIRDVEEAAKRMVEEASKRLEAEKQHEKDHETLRTGNGSKPDDKPVTEEVPKKVRKLTKLLWGDSE